MFTLTLYNSGPLRGMGDGLTTWRRYPSATAMLCGWRHVAKRVERSWWLWSLTFYIMLGGRG